MILIVGLGNPGKKFENTRHNVGFMAVDIFAKNNGFPEFVLQKKANALISELDSVILVKPETFMNESGKAIQEIIKQNPAESIIVIHDDIDLPIGKIKIVQERGSAGHKGVESIIQNIGNDGLIRIRIGISPAQSHGLDHGSLEAKDIVLKNFSPDEQRIIDEVISKTAQALKHFSENGLEKTMNEYNG